MLTICIQTFNRHAILEEALNDLLPKVREYNIPVIVVDNCSTDGTRELVELLMQSNPFLRYFCQPYNVGYDLNFESALRYSDSEYTWVLGDSIRINADYLPSILNYLESYHPDIYTVNSLDRVTDIPSCTYTDANQFLYDLGWHLTLLSMTIYSRNVIQNANFEKYYNSHFIHFAILFDAFAKSNNFKVYWDERPVTFGSEMRKTNSWNPYRIIEIFGRAWSNIVLNLPGEVYTEVAKLHCIRIHGKKGNLFTTRRLMRQRAVGGLSWKIYKEYKSDIRIFAPDRKLAILFFALCPNLFNKYYWRYKKSGNI